MCAILLPNKLYHNITKKVLEHSLRLFEPMEGIEPTTPRLQITCSGQLSYIGKMLPFSKGSANIVILIKIQHVEHKFIIQSCIF